MVAVGTNFGAVLSLEQLQQILLRLSPALSEEESSLALADMDSNGNGVVTGQELGAWFVKTELNIALLDLSSFPDPAPAKIEKAKKDESAGNVTKRKKRAKSKMKVASTEPDLDGDGNDLKHSTSCETDIYASCPEDDPDVAIDRGAN